MTVEAEEDSAEAGLAAEDAIDNSRSDIQNHSQTFH
jgi:hypothetical protein